MDVGMTIDDTPKGLKTSQQYINTPGIYDLPSSIPKGMSF
jgi:hypothetical protein